MSPEKDLVVMKLFSRKGLAAAVAATAISTSALVATPAFAAETESALPTQLSSFVEGLTSSDKGATTAATNAGAGAAVAATTTTATTTTASKGSSTEEAKEAKEWLGVVASIITVLTSIFAFATKYLK